MQQPTPSANGVINNPTLAEMSTPSPQVLPEQWDDTMSLFSNNAAQQNGTLPLGVNTQAQAQAAPFANPWAPQASQQMGQNPMMQSFMGGMGMTPQQQAMMGRPIAPPSEA